MSLALIDKALRVGERKQMGRYNKLVEKINEIEPEMELLELDEIRAEADSLRERAQGGESLDDLLPEAFALVREASRRTLGMRHFDVQLLGGIALHEGNVSEMKTGEGKTLTATLPVFLNSLAGEGVHLVTVNDYLARRDAEWMGPIYAALGMTVGVIQEEMDPPERQEAYASDVTYGTNSEFGFDYLRDNLAHDAADKVQRGHAYAIVDEVDNILIDEARTPLIISGQPEEAGETYHRFARLAKQMQGIESKPKLKSLGESKDTSEADHDYEYDEKHKTVSPTERGIERAEKFLGVEHLFLSEHGSLVNHLIQALKAESLYVRDKDYAVVDGEVMIIDEFTGRIMEGRRWSEGLHQAIEAKEGLKIQEEHQTVASITYQNYFRRYQKLAGMTGTALTEATELMKIYKVPVLEIPTNKPMVRLDNPDLIYKSKDSKWRAVRGEIIDRHGKGQPILVGTASVEASELLSGMLTRDGIEHVVLNAKPEYAEREGETIAQAGRAGAVTIATNMAGRGVDIKLGGDPEQMARHEAAKKGLDPSDPEVLAEIAARLENELAPERERVIEAGGLYVIGTERHESRRIDNQLRGRSGRQGDPGESRFFISAEDDLIRLFAGEKIYRVMERLSPTDDEGNEIPLESGMLSKQIERAQSHVEEQNFLVRKRVLEYDDVLNQQREVIYGWRDEILEGRDVSELVRDNLAKLGTDLTSQYLPGDFIDDWDLAGLRLMVEGILPGSGELVSDKEEHSNQLAERLQLELLSAYDSRERDLGDELMRSLERNILLQIIDERWREHLADMDYMRQGIHLRGFAQIDPLVAYKNEGFKMFEALVETIWQEFARYLFHVQVEIVEEELSSERPRRAEHLSYASGGEEIQSEAPAVETVVKDENEKLGRNDPCWCERGQNEGIKFKHCHGR